MPIGREDDPDQKMRAMREEDTQPVKRLPKLTEHQEQALLIDWFDHYAPTKGIDPRCLMAIPNAGKRSFAAAAWLRAEGLRPDAPDLFLAVPTRLFPGLFIEMKRRGQKARPGQVEYASVLRRAGYNAIIAAGFEEAQRAIRAYVEKQ